MKRLIQTLILLLLVTQVSFAQWMQVGLEDKTIKDIAARNSNIFAITADSESVYRSTDNGNNWTVIVDTGAVDIAVAPIGTVFLLEDNTLFSSSDNGATWDTITVIEQIIPPPWPLTPELMNVSVSRTGVVYCGISIPGWPKGSSTFIASSADGGFTWTTPGLDLMGGKLFDYKGENVISAGYDNGLYDSQLGWNDIYLSTDNGYTWSDLGMAPINIFECQVLSLCLNGNILVGGGALGWWEGLFLSADSCTTWLQISWLSIQAGLSIESGGTLVSADSLGVFFFSDDGDSLGSRNGGLTNLNIHTLTIDNNNYVYAGTDNGVWRRPLSEIVTSIKETSTALPSEFLLLM